MSRRRAAAPASSIAVFAYVMLHLEEVSLLTADDATSEVQLQLLACLRRVDPASSPDALLVALECLGANALVLDLAEWILAAPGELQAEGGALLGERRRVPLRLEGALAQWRELVAEGRFDERDVGHRALRAVACREANALEWQRMGLHDMAAKEAAESRELAERLAVEVQRARASRSAA